MRFVTFQRHAYTEPGVVVGEEICGLKGAGFDDVLSVVAGGADALAIEATYLEEEREMARQFAHLTAKQAAELAGKAGVKKLILTHISRRYPGSLIEEEARTIFPNTWVCSDLDQAEVKRVKSGPDE